MDIFFAKEPYGFEAVKNRYLNGGFMQVDADTTSFATGLACKVTVEVINLL